MEISIKKIIRNTTLVYNEKEKLIKIIVFGIYFDYIDNNIVYNQTDIDATIINKKEGSFVKFHDLYNLRITIGIENYIHLNRYYNYDEELFVCSNNYKFTDLDILTILDKYEEIFKNNNCSILFLDETKAIIRINEVCEIYILTTYLYIENIYLIELLYPHILYKSQYKEFVYKFFTEFGFKMEKPPVVPSILSFL